MFSKTIVDSDAFLDMPLSAQALYFHLSMRADDDGFLNNAKKIQKAINASEDDLKILLLKRFVIAFDDGIIVIKHWRMNNYLRNDRHKPTVYQEELAMLEIKENGAYSLKIDDKNMLGIPNDNQMTTQYRLDKDRLDKDSIDIYMSEKSDECVEEKSKSEQLKHDFDIIYKSYPKKVGKTKGFEYYKAWVTKGRDISGIRYHLTNKQIWAAIAKYKHEMEQKETDLQFYKNFDTFMCKAILDYVEEEE